MTHQTITSEPAAIAPSSGFTDVILRRLRVAELRAKVVANEIEATAVALSAGLITPDMAVLLLAEVGIEVSS